MPRFGTILPDSLFSDKHSILAGVLDHYRSGDMTIAQTARPSIPVPKEIASLVSVIRETFHPTEIWLFGSRAKGTARSDSDWDLLAVLDDNASADLSDPILAWSISRQSGVPSTVLTASWRDLEEIWGLPNTLGYDLSREGVRLLVS
jgi:hypothetical protein